MEAMKEMGTKESEDKDDKLKAQKRYVVGKLIPRLLSCRDMWSRATC